MPLSISPRSLSFIFYSWNMMRSDKQPKYNLGIFIKKEVLIQSRSSSSQSSLLYVRLNQHPSFKALTHTDLSPYSFPGLFVMHAAPYHLKYTTSIQFLMDLASFNFPFQSPFVQWIRQYHRSVGLSSAWICSKCSLLGDDQADAFSLIGNMLPSLRQQTIASTSLTVALF